MNYGRNHPVPSGGYVLSEPSAGETRMWNGASTLVFTVQRKRPRGAVEILYTTGATGTTSCRELYEASHVIAPAPDGVATDADVATELPVRGLFTLPPVDGTARARELASEHIRRARARFDHGVPPKGRRWRPGDEPRLRVLDTAATTLARLAAVYLTSTSARNTEEARAYALAFQLVEASARRLAHRRITR